jgi:hypothetical protein
MGFAEALSDDGALSGHGQHWLRGSVCGAMTTLGGIGHTLPYLIPSFAYANRGVVVDRIGSENFGKLDTPSFRPKTVERLEKLCLFSTQDCA